MRFETIPYMEWAKKGVDWEDPELINLSTSGVRPLLPSLAAAGISPTEMPLNGSAGYGYQPLLDTIAARYGVQPGNVLSAQGTSMANFLLLAVLLQPGDILLVEHPVYPCLPAAAKALGARVVPFERREEDGWQLPAEDLRSLCYASGAVGVLLTNPHNPSGAFTPDEEMVRLAEEIGKDRFLIVDEVYREWLPEEGGRTAAMTAENLFITSSLTKVFGLSSLRTGWAIASAEVVRRARRAYDHMGVNEPFPTTWMAWRLMSEPGVLTGLRKQGMDEIEEGRRQSERFFHSSTGRKLKGVFPSAGGHAFLRPTMMPGTEFARRLLEEQKVVVTPGHFFGSDDHVRISWTQGLDKVEEGYSRIGFWLRNRVKK